MMDVAAFLPFALEPWRLLGFGVTLGLLSAYLGWRERLERRARAAAKLANRVVA